MDAAEPGTASHAEFHPLTPELWSDLEQLFGARGACGGCWCMWWRLSAGEFAAGNRAKVVRTINGRTTEIDAIAPSRDFLISFRPSSNWISTAAPPSSSLTTSP